MGASTRFGWLAASRPEGAPDVRELDSVLGQQLARSKRCVLIINRASAHRPSRNSLCRWVVGRSGAVFERFFNGKNWVYIPHVLPEGVSALHVSVVDRSVVVHTASGGVLRRSVGPDRRLQWLMVALPPEMRVATLLSADSWRGTERSLWTISVMGDLWEMHSCNGSWQQYHHPRGDPLVALADVHSLRDGSVFAVAAGGMLWELVRGTTWRQHALPPAGQEGLSRGFAPLAGVSLPLRGGSSTLLLLAADGSGLMERRWDPSGRAFSWQFHPAPAWLQPSAVLTGPLSVFFLPSGPGAATELVPVVLVVAADGTVLEFAARGRAAEPGVIESAESTSQLDWRWARMTTPEDTQIATASAVTLEPGRLLFLAADGRLAEYEPEGFGPAGAPRPGRPPSPTQGRWSIHEVPETEGGNAGYCALEAGPYNCMTGVVSSVRLRTEALAGVGMDVITATAVVPAAKGSRGRPLVPVAPWLSGAGMQLRLMLPHSLFVLGPGGMMHERFFNGHAAVWVAHDQPRRLVAVAAVFNFSVIVLDDAGVLHIRERHGDSLRWRRLSAAPGRGSGIDGDESGAAAVPLVGVPPWDQCCAHPQWGVRKANPWLHFLGADGALKELAMLPSGRTAWRDTGPVPGGAGGGDVRPTIADSHVLRARCTFVVGVDGVLYQYNQVTGTWTMHALPSSMGPLAPAAGAVHRSLDTPAGSLFLRARSGALLERRWELLGPGSSEGFWRWVDHGRPPLEDSDGTPPVLGGPVGPVGPTLVDGSVFLVTEQGCVVQRAHLGTGMWAWLQHDFPGKSLSHGPLREALRAARVGSGVTIDTAESVVAFPLVGGLLGLLRAGEAPRGGDAQLWTWAVVDVPAVVVRPPGAVSAAQGAAADRAHQELLAEIGRELAASGSKVALEAATLCTASPGPFNCLQGLETPPAL